MEKTQLRFNRHVFTFASFNDNHHKEQLSVIPSTQVTDMKETRLVSPFLFYLKVIKEIGQ